MRYVNVFKSQTGRITRIMLVTYPQNPKYTGLILGYFYDTEDDGPSCGGELYDMPISEVFDLLDETTNWKKDNWRELPDQSPGCLDEWIEPVRQARDEQGHPIRHFWEKLTPDGWVRFTRERN